MVRSSLPLPVLFFVCVIEPGAVLSYGGLLRCVGLRVDLFLFSPNPFLLSTLVLIYLYSLRVLDCCCLRSVRHTPRIPPPFTCVGCLGLVADLSIGRCSALYSWHPPDDSHAYSFFLHSTSFVVVFFFWDEHNFLLFQPHSHLVLFGHFFLSLPVQLCVGEGVCAGDYRSFVFYTGSSFLFRLLFCFLERYAAIFASCDF